MKNCTRSASLSLLVGFFTTVGIHSEVLAAPESASALFAEGLKLYAAEDYLGASRSFKLSFSEKPDQATLFAWAQSERLQGNCGIANDLFADYIAKSPEESQRKAAFRLMKECKSSATVAPTPREEVPTPPSQPQTLPTPSIEQGTPLSESIPIYQRWELFAGGAILGIAGGSLLALNAQGIVDDAESLPDGTEFSVIRSLEKRASQRTLYANLSFVSAGAMGGIALWMYFRQRGTTDTDKSATSIRPALSHESVGVVLRQSF